MMNTQKKLALSKETLRSLDDEDLTGGPDPGKARNISSWIRDNRDYLGSSGTVSLS
jgi:hypothetical protein